MLVSYQCTCISPVIEEKVQRENVLSYAKWNYIVAYSYSLNTITTLFDINIFIKILFAGKYLIMPSFFVNVKFAM